MLPKRPLTGKHFVDFSSLDGKRIAVIIRFPNQSRVVRGSARYVRPKDSQSVLRIQLDTENDEAGTQVLYLHEGEWNGRIEPDGEYGCDHQIGISVQ
jgi:hypothetical protein